MRKTLNSTLVLASLLLAPLFLQAQGTKEGQTPPTVMLRVQSFESLVSNFKTLAKAAGQEEIGNQIDALINKEVGPGGLEGIDTKKPIGIYGDLNAQSGAVMIPIKDQKKFLKVLGNFNVTVEKEKDSDVYVLDHPLLNNIKIGLRFLNGYAYIAGPNPNVLAKASDLITPAQAFPKGLDAVLSGTIRFDQIPDGIKTTALQKLEDEIKNLKDEADKKYDNVVLKKFAHQAIDAGGKQLEDFLKGATDVSGQLKIDPKTHKIGVELTVDGKSDSALKKTIAGLAQNQSLFAAPVSKGADAVQQIHVVLPADLKKALNGLLEAEINKGLEKEPDAEKKAFAKKIVDAITPTLYSGDFDLASALQISKDGQVTFVGGLRVKQGAKLEETFRELHKKLPASEQGEIKLDVAKIGNVNIHSINIGPKLPPDAKKVLGEGPVYFAVSADALLIAGGKNGMDALKEIAETPAAPSTKVLYYEYKVGPIANLLAKTANEKAAAKKAFANDPGLIRISVEGGQKLQVNFSASISILEFGIALYQKAQEAQFKNDQVKK